MTKDKISVPDTRLNARTRRLFLNHLAETANVAASARAAGVASSGVYAERRRSEPLQNCCSLAIACSLPMGKNGKSTKSNMDLARHTLRHEWRLDRYRSIR